MTECAACGAVSVREEASEGLQLALCRPVLDHAAATEPDGTEDDGGVEPSPFWDALTDNVTGWGSWVAESLLGPIFPGLVYGDEGDALVLEECLENYFGEESMTGSNRYACDACGGKRDAWKRQHLTKPPEILMVTLKRFEYNRHGPRKLNRPVQFPLSGLDLTPYLHREPGTVPTPCTYHLCSLIAHRGRPFGGHYFAYAYSEHDAQWYCYNDDDVYPVRASTVAAEQAYILFYQRGETRKPRDSDSIETAAEVATVNAKPGTKFVLISRRWLALADTMDTPPPIDNRDFVCQHGGLMPDRVAILVDLAAEVTEELYAALVDAYGELPESHVKAAAVCPECKARCDQLNARRQAEHRILDAPEAGPFEVVIAKDWLDKWETFVLSKAIDVHPPGPISNASILTNDGRSMRRGLHPNHDYQLLSASEWRGLLGAYGGGPLIRIVRGRAYVDVGDEADTEVESDPESTAAGAAASEAGPMTIETAAVDGPVPMQSPEYH
eukprot:CAMPEP_0182932886 /NCGR_PEP_ID=MMETSP0105_2-20130417/32495_1 /TAXON_ID=81532 ORGANISM="Acanthoeca-like sp., Strain 10tr" /NCGR_SAMPLE_ID=MMETSP0105_2 /ASSEMBLY_ACC=CAM_ASM_000205 /LENGTH=497 /DNA_ID=CAMNT_0025071543 /DNA_START=8 /DNA_END=1501 /DNA_ORIENTATION=-